MQTQGAQFLGAPAFVQLAEGNQMTMAMTEESKVEFRDQFKTVASSIKNPKLRSNIMIAER